MEKALKWGDVKAIKKADYNWRIVTSIVKDLRETNPNFVEPSLIDQLIYGKEEKRGERAPEKLTSTIWIDCGVNSETCTPTRRVKVLSPPFGRNLTVGFKNKGEKRRIIVIIVVLFINKDKKFSHYLV